MHSPEAEILAQIHRVQAELSPTLPAEIRMESRDIAAVQIRIQLLRARLDLTPEQEQIPLPLTQLLALLFELVGHLEGLGASARPLAGEAFPEVAAPTAAALLEAMRETALNGETVLLRSVLFQQRRAFVGIAPQELVPIPLTAEPQVPAEPGN